MTTAVLGRGNCWTGQNGECRKLEKKRCEKEKEKEKGKERERERERENERENHTNTHSSIAVIFLISQGRAVIESDGDPDGFRQHIRNVFNCLLWCFECELSFFDQVLNHFWPYHERNNLLSKGCLSTTRGRLDCGRGIGKPAEFNRSHFWFGVRVIPSVVSLGKGVDDLREGIVSLDDLFGEPLANLFQRTVSRRNL